MCHALIRCYSSILFALLLLGGAAQGAQLALTNYFVIEAEDFNFNKGQTVPDASQMPYLGGAFVGQNGAVAQIDYGRTADASSPLYRNDVRIPIQLSSDLDRGAWTVTQNWRLVGINGNEWFNYTRNIPPGKYLAYAALSHGNTGVDLCQGSLSFITSAPSNAVQSTSKKGTFKAPGTGNWDVNTLVPLRDTQNRIVLMDLGTNQTLRYTAISGAIDYLKLVRAQAPIIGNQPIDVTVIENRIATFTISLGSDDAGAFQWQTNQVSVSKATTNSFSLAAPLSLNGLKVRCVLTNVIGTTLSTEVTLHVVPDTTKPILTRALNLGANTVRLVFDEPVLPPAGAAGSNFTLSGGLPVVAVASGSDANSIDLMLGAPMAYDQSYTVTASGVTDQASAPNTMLPLSQVSFVSVQFVAADIGKPGAAGSATRVPGGFNVTGAGSDVGGTADQFQFSWEPRSGDFDIQTRVANATITDAFLHAGLMARESLTSNAVFAASFAASAQVGCFFEYRKTTGTTTAMGSAPGGAPVNYPQTWLRLRRAGTLMTGYSSLDGLTWVVLGSNNFTTLSNTLLVGLAVASEDSKVTSTVEFRDIGDALNPTNIVTTLPDRELLGPSSRRTGLVFSEIMYHPRPGPAGSPNLQFIEIYNADSVFEELAGFEISGDVQYQFPAGKVLQTGEFLVIAADPAAVQAAYGIKGVLGPWTGVMNSKSGTLQIKDNHGAMKLDVTYFADSPWPVAADGAGPSLVITRPSFGEADPRAWSASAYIGGSPGQMDPYIPTAQHNVLINELLAHTELPQLDFIELYNHSSAAVDLSNCYLTDDPTTNKFRIAAGTSIPATGFLSWDQTQLGFALVASGETIYFIDASGKRILDVVRFDAQEKGVSTGRMPDGSPSIRRLATTTPGTTNSNWRAESIVINELMYHPMSNDNADEYIELYNRGNGAVDLSGWTFVSGVSFVIPPATVLQPDRYLVIAKNPARLLSNYPQLNAGNTLGGYGGSLGNGGDRVALAKPAPLVTADSQGHLSTNSILVTVSEVTYRTGGRWGKWAAGGGSSLELVDAHADLTQPSSWADSDESAKAPWTTLTVTDNLDNGNTTYAPNRLHVHLQGAGECLVDDVEIFKFGGTNLCLNGNFDSAVSSQKWELFGNMALSNIDTNGGIGDSRCLHLRAQGDGDTGVNSCRRALVSQLIASTTNVTLRAKARWIAGWPELLLRVSGNYMELPGKLIVPKNLGTPGQPNSRRVNNAGPSIVDVLHSPALPKSSQPVLVTCRVSDFDGVGAVTLRYRYDPAQTLTNVVMHDDGANGDLVAGDGIYSGVIPGRTSGIAAFRVEATDLGTVVATNVFPPLVPAQECLIRWGEAIPFGSFGHYHLWSTAATESARGSSSSLNNMFRDATLVYGNGRIIYDAGFRDKGSPYHSGQGDFALTVADDDLLLGVNDRIFGATGNGGQEATQLKGRIANWISGQLGIPFLHAHYILLYRNGSQHASVSEDNEQPNNYFAGSWFPSGIAGELYKIAVWFEDDSTSGATGATMEQFRTTGGGYDLARYRWNWQLRPNESANNYTNLFKLVDALNAPGDHVPGMLSIADVEQWMRVFAFHRITGNWDSWTYNVGQNMFLYRQPGGRWILIPWDIDFVLGEGDGATGDLITTIQDPIAATRLYGNFAFRRMLFRAFQDAIAGPLQPARYAPQVEARKQILIKNRIGATAPTDVGSYIDTRRETIRSLLAVQDVSGLTITNNNGNDFIAGSAVVSLLGKAPFAVATIEINGIPYPVKWTGYSSFSISVPLAAGANVLSVVGKDLRGNVVTSGTDTITVTFNGVPQPPKDFIVINELQFNPLYPKTSFIEIYNRSLTTPFDLSGYRLSGVGYTFPEGSLIAPNGFLVLAKDRAAFYNTYGSEIFVLDEFLGSLNGGGEHIQLIKPGNTPDLDVVINDVRYDNILPWPLNADGFGPSLQLIDPAVDTYRVGNWSAAATNALKVATPGRTNNTRQVLSPFPLVWLNEVLPRNVKSQIDNQGEHDPFVELYNSGNTVLDLSAYYLTDTYTNLTQWRFPAGTTIPAKGFITLWADGQPAQTAPGAIHTPFKLDPVAGSLALVRMQGSPSAPAVMDYLNYSGLPADQSFGSYPDGEPRGRRSFYYPTPFATNNPVYPDLKLSINEVMADNQKTLVDSASGKYSDWIELYNGSDAVVDMTNYRLTDNLTNTTRFVIPSGYTIPPKGFLLVWADGDLTLNQPVRPDLHVNFKLSKNGKSVGLYSPDNRLVDGFSFGAQIPDMSLGHFPDGATTSLIYMPQPTPRKKNDATDANLPPTITPIAAKVVDELTLLTFKAIASDENPGQTLSFALVNNPPTGTSIDPATGVVRWTPDESQGPGNFTLNVQVTDNGVPPISVTIPVLVHVNEVNSAPGILSLSTQSGASDVPLRFQVVGVDTDIPAQDLTYSLPPGSPLGAGINPLTGEFIWTPNADQGGDYDMVIIVKDNGTPPIAQPFHVLVKIKGPDAIPSPVITATRAPDGTMTLSWPAVDGVKYHVEFTETLGTLSWNPLGDTVGAQGIAGISGIQLDGQTERYYRVIITQ